MSYQHAVVWMDHLRAVVIDFSVDKEHVHLVASETEQRQVHRKSGAPGTGKAADDHVFFDAVVDAIGDATEVLITGPGQAKLAFRKDLERRHPAAARKVVGVESADHPQVGELLKEARRYFRRYDNLRGV